jgi:hypothetical protein
MTDGHDLIYRRSPQEAAARRKRIYGSARYKPRQPGEMTWNEYKAQMEREEAARKLEPLAGKPKKRRAGPGCRYKPAAPKWKPGLRDVRMGQVAGHKLSERKRSLVPNDIV